MNRGNQLLMSVEIFQVHLAKLSIKTKHLKNHSYFIKVLRTHLILDFFSVSIYLRVPCRHGCSKFSAWILFHPSNSSIRRRITCPFPILQFCRNDPPLFILLSGCSTCISTSNDFLLKLAQQLHSHLTDTPFLMIQNCNCEILFM